MLSGDGVIDQIAYTDADGNAVIVALTDDGEITIQTGTDEPPVPPEDGRDKGGGDSGNNEWEKEGGNSGSTPPTIPPIRGEEKQPAVPYVPKAGDKLAKEDLPTTMIPQILATNCVTATMEYINHALGGSINEGDFMDYCKDKFGMNLMVDGFKGNLEQFKQMTSDFFYTTFINSSDIASEINNGNVVMTDISGFDNSTHSVCIVGTTSDGNYIIMNPASGVLESVSPSSIVGTYYIGIAENK